MINKVLQKKPAYLKRNCLNQDCHHHQYQYDFCHKKLLLKE